MAEEYPASIRTLQNGDVRTQFAALCYRMSGGKPEILLITSRRSGRWIVPKGWPIDGLTPAGSAAREAWEEAGVIGKHKESCIGLFSYTKTDDCGVGMPCMVMVYPVKVSRLDSRFPEKGQRRRKWLSPKKAAARVEEPELARILRDFDPAKLG